MSTPPPTAGWFYADGRGGSVGPYPHAAFADIAASGALPPDTPVFCAAVGSAWLKLSEAARDHLGVRVPTPAPTAAPAVVTASPPARGPPSPPDGEREFVDDDGTKFVWDAGVRRFVPVEGGRSGGAAAAAATAAAAAVPAYAVEDMTFPAATAANGGRRPLAATPAAKPTAADVVAKHAKRGRAAAAAAAGPSRAWDPARAAAAEAVSVYVTGLPPDVTRDEVAAAFGRCGLIKPAADGSGPRVKLYADPATGAPKGDAVVTFLKAPSVDLAMTLLDGAQLRPGDAATTMAVSRARFGERDGGGSGGAAGPAPAAASAAAPPLSKKARLAMAAAIDRALGWDGDDGAADDPPAARTVVLRGAFDAAAAVADAAARRSLEAALAALGGEAGGGVAVRARAHAGGVAVLRYRSGEAAARAVSRLSGRAWRGRELDADLWDGVEAFGALGDGRARGTGGGDGGGDDDAARLAAFAAELEAKGGG